MVLGEKAIEKTAWVVEGGNLRAEPSPGSKVLSEVYTGVLWYEINVDGVTCWVSKAMTTLLQY